MNWDDEKRDKWAAYIPLQSVLTEQEYKELDQAIEEPKHSAEVIVLADWKSARGL